MKSIRKYVATVSQLVDMDQHELGWLAKYFGHDIDIHKEFWLLLESFWRRLMREEIQIQKKKLTSYYSWKWSKSFNRSWNYEDVATDTNKDCFCFITIQIWKKLMKKS